MRVAYDHLTDDSGSHGFEIEGTTLLVQLCQENDLEEQIAQLLAHMCGLVGIECVEQLGRFFKQVRPHRGHALRAIPRTLVPQARHEAS